MYVLDEVQRFAYMHAGSMEKVPVAFLEAEQAHSTVSYFHDEAHHSEPFIKDISSSSREVGPSRSLNSDLQSHLDWAAGWKSR